jgi:hypothetical protein
LRIILTIPFEAITTNTLLIHELIWLAKRLIDEAVLWEEALNRSARMRIKACPTLASVNRCEAMYTEQSYIALHENSKSSGLYSRSAQYQVSDHPMIVMTLPFQRHYCDVQVRPVAQLTDSFPFNQIQLRLIALFVNLADRIPRMFAKIFTLGSTTIVCCFDVKQGGITCSTRLDHQRSRLDRSVAVWPDRS